LAVACIALFGALYGLHIQYTQQPIQPLITPATSEEFVRKWLTTFNYPVTRESAENTYFSLKIGLPSGRVAVVGRVKERDQYISIQGIVTVDPQHLVILNKMPKDQLSRFRHDVAIQLASLNIDFVELSTLQNIIVLRRIPINEGLTESSFIDTVGAVDRAELLIVEMVRREVKQ